MSIGRWRRMIFGSKTEKTEKLFPKGVSPLGPDPVAAEKSKGKGHGRKGAKDYPGAKHVRVAHPDLAIGGLCPQCLKAKLSLLKVPARLIRRVAQPIFHATIYELERLRCALCGALFTAPTPAQAGQSKYDPSVGTLLSIMRYGAGLPMYRMEKWQTCFGVPLPASTQWELINAASQTPEVIYETLLSVAAQGRRVHNDDTPLRVQDLRRAISTDPQGGERTGIFTTSILSDIDRLAFHQEKSGPIMEDLQPWLKAQLDQKKVEPNSGLGQAIRYLIKHWKALTRFPQIAGAPLDNNICERALKMAILHRKNSRSYKTSRGARVGDIFLSLIHTCQINQVNPFTYLMALVNNAGEVLKDPTRWLPWNHPAAEAAPDTG